MFKWVSHFACSNLYIFCMNFVHKLYTWFLWCTLFAYHNWRIFIKCIQNISLISTNFCKHLFATFGCQFFNFVYIQNVYKSLSKCGIHYVCYIFCIHRKCIYFGQFLYLKFWNSLACRYTIGTQVISKVIDSVIQFWEKFTITIWKRWKWTVKRKFVY